MVLIGKTNMDEFADGLVERKFLFGPCQESLDLDCTAAVGRFRGGGRGAARSRGDRHRHRRIDPPAGGPVGRVRDQADLRRLLALWARRFASSLDTPGVSAGRPPTARCY